MKKLLLVAALGVAGVMSASINPVPKEFEKSKALKANEFTCISITYSCGWPGFICGNSIGEIAFNAWESDNYVCGN